MRAMIAAVPQLQFTGQSAFSWWAVVAGAVAVALLVYAVLLWRQGGTGAAGGGRGRESLTVFGFAAPLVAGVLGVCALAGTAALLVAGASPGLAALVFVSVITLAAVWLFYLRVYRYLSRFRMVTLLGLRVAGIVALLLLLFQPVLALVPDAGERRKIAVVIDASGSMSIADSPNEPNRYRQSVLAARDILIPALADTYTAQVYAYDGKHLTALESPDALDAIVPAGGTSDLAVAVSLATGGGAEQVVLFSDGIHNGPVTVGAGFANKAVPATVHTVRVGNTVTEPSTVPDIAVTAIDGPQTATVNTTITLTASVRSTAMADRTVKVQLASADGAQVHDEQRLVLRSGPTPQTVQLKFQPAQVGRAVVRVSVPVDPQERSDANNVQEFPLLVTDPKLPVFYVEGRVRPEVGPLRRMLEQDPNIAAISLVQTTAGRFELSGVKAGDDLKGMPTTLAQWKRFKVIVLGDLDASFLNAQQQKDLQQAVREGAGLVMIGGQNAFAPGGWDKTTLAEVLPVSLAKVTPAQINSPFVPRLTAAGLNHAIFRDIAGFFVDPTGAASAQQMPPLSGAVALHSAKPAANVLAVHPTETINNAPAIVLAVGNYGQGRTVAFAADTTWRWKLFLGSLGKDSPYNRFWGQMIRWAAAREELEKKTGASVTAMIPKERYEPGEPVTLRAAVTDREGQATRYAQVKAVIKSPDGKTVTVPLAAMTDQIGVYDGTHKPAMAGAYEVRFTGSKDALVLGEDKSSFTVIQAAGEMDVLAAQPGTLEEIANATGGAYSDVSGVGALAQRLAARGAPVAAQPATTVPLYHTRWFFPLFIVLLGTEIFLRRKWQLQ